MAKPAPFAAYFATVHSLESLLRPFTEPASEAELRLHFERMGYLMAQLGRPEQAFPAVHVAGTSGKGSTTALIGSILRAAGLRTGVHLTPYLQTAIERIQVGELYVSPADFVALVKRMRPAIAHMQAVSSYHSISYRELAVAQAFLHFAGAGLDMAAVETGMGGRYDYTNHLKPVVSTIVTVDYDHTATLGSTLARIAQHKAGIIKKGVPAVTGVQAPEALAVIEAEAQRQQAPLLRLGREIACRNVSVGPQGCRFDYESAAGRLADVQLGVLGRHQATNAALAIASVELLRELGYAISEEAIRRGLSAARLPGRLEIVQHEPLVVLDAAHNPEKMRALATALREVFPSQRPVVVLGVLAAKQAAAVLAEILPLARQVVVTSPIVQEKPAVPANELAALCARFNLSASVEPDPPTAVGRGRELAGAGGLVCVTGSLYMVGQVRSLWAPVAAILEQRTSFPRV